MDNRLCKVGESVGSFVWFGEGPAAPFRKQELCSPFKSSFTLMA